MFVLDEVSSLQPRENVGGIATIARYVLLRYWGNSRIHCTCYSTLHTLPSTVAAAEAISSMDHNDHLPCQLLPSVKTDFGQILWHAWIRLS